MPKFNITINPAVRMSYGSVQVVVTSILKRATVECALDELPAAMVQAAQGVVSKLPDAPLLSVYASVEGRSFKAFKAFAAADKNKLVIDPAAMTAPATETADAV